MITVATKERHSFFIIDSADRWSLCPSFSILSTQSRHQHRNSNVNAFLPCTHQSSSIKLEASFQHTRLSVTIDCVDHWAMILEHCYRNRTSHTYTHRHTHIRCVHCICIWCVCDCVMLYRSVHCTVQSPTGMWLNYGLTKYRQRSSFGRLSKCSTSTLPCILVVRVPVREITVTISYCLWYGAITAVERLWPTNGLKMNINIPPQKMLFWDT